jgi:polyferredoxin
MQITRTVRRTIAAVFLTAGLAYPACAAVCPKGIGGCPSPGRCFLFADADMNSLCDYTSRAGSQAPGAFPARPVTAAPAQTAIQTAAVPSPAAQAVPVTTAPAPVTDTTAPVLQQASGGGFFDGAYLFAPLLGAALFLIFTGILFVLVRRGTGGVQVEKTRPALALSALFGLGASLIVTCILAGGTIAGTSFALMYMGAGTLLAAYLWHAGVMTRKIALGAAALSALSGFVFLAPVMPLELGGIVNFLTGVSALTPGVIVMCALVLLALLVGRAFCGQVCPVGSLQELAYAVPVQKIEVRSPKIPEGVRLAVFFTTVIAAVYLIDLMALTGLYDLFSLTVSAGLAVAAALVLLSVFYYRPVCRALCPFGVLFSLSAEFSLFRLRRTATCIGCRKCERACPALTAGAHDAKRECYLCGRCRDACPVGDALVYRR